jgi:hypothetical protein
MFLDFSMIHNCIHFKNFKKQFIFAKEWYTFKVSIHHRINQNLKTLLTSQTNFYFYADTMKNADFQN